MSTSVKHTVSRRNLIHAIKDLTALAADPIGRQLIAERLEGWVRRRKVAGDMLDKVQIMFRYFRDPAEPWKPKLLVGAALLYLVIPNDLIPDWIAVVGLTDDFAAITIVWKQLYDVLTHYEERRLLRQAAEERA